MSSQPHTDPTQAFFGALAGEIARQVVEQVRPSVTAAAPLEDALEKKLAAGVDLWKPYTAKEVGDFLGLSASRVYKIPEDQLRPTWTGPTGGSKRYLGINVLMYVLRLDPVDAEEIGRRVRERFIREAEEPVGVRSLPGLNGRKRIV